MPATSSRGRGLAEDRGHARLAEDGVRAPARRSGSTSSTASSSALTARRRPGSRPRSGTRPRRSSCTGTRASSPGADPEEQVGVVAVGPAARGRVVGARRRRARPWRRPRAGRARRGRRAPRSPGATATNTRRPSSRCGPRRSASRSRTLATATGSPSSERRRRGRAPRAVSGPKMPSRPSPTLRWNSRSARGGVGAEDAVFVAGVEAERVEAALELDDVVAAQHRAADVEHPVAEAEAALDQRGPRLAAADAVDAQRSRAPGTRATLTSVRGRTEVPSSSGGDRREPSATRRCWRSRTASPLLPGRSDGRIAQPMNSARSWRSWPLPLAPTMRFTGSPSLKTSSVGMLITS